MVPRRPFSTWDEPTCPLIPTLHPCLPPSLPLLPTLPSVDISLSYVSLLHVSFPSCIPPFSYVFLFLSSVSFPSYMQPLSFLSFFLISIYISSHFFNLPTHFLILHAILSYYFLFFLIFSNATPFSSHPPIIR